MKHELLAGVFNALPLILLGLLLGIFTATDNARTVNKKSLISILVVVFSFTIGRYSAYTVMHIESAYSTKPLAALIWTLCMGLWIGVIYRLLEQGLK